VKVKPFRAPRPIVAGVAQGRTILRGAWSIFRTQKTFALGLFAGALTLGLFVWPHDRQILETFHWWSRGHQETYQNIGWYLSTWGDYLTYNVPFALAIWLYGVAAKNSSWRRAAIVCFLGATLAGIFNDCFRLTLGRPRPDAHMPDRFYGITYAFSGGFQSFPSGHAASVFGAAMGLVMVKRPLGIIATLFALAVVWARLEINRHYPSDVVVGSVIGIYFGLLVGFGAKAREPLRLKSR